MISRIKIVVRGAVQGVGFRPFIYRLSTELKLNGYVLNSTNGVFIEAEGKKELLKKFLLRVDQEKPRSASISSLEYSYLDPVGYDSFEIRKSSMDTDISTQILPDIAVCDDCLREMNDPKDRRYQYPFINCTNCGPRFSIIERLPYDRPNTSMKIFEMCSACRQEYEDPLDRRFHAQPIACPVCGPRIELWDSIGKIKSVRHEALVIAAELIKSGKIVALKGLGGFQLIVDATNREAITLLRIRKHREEKPLALMFPNLKEIQKVCEVSDLEKRLLQSPESPIVLLRIKDKFALPLAFTEIVPGNPYLGVMLPYTPLHHLLLAQVNSPVIATSGNISDEPICINEESALSKLSEIADYFLVHNRPIVRHVDDSIARVILDREMVLRRARGYAPLPISISKNYKFEKRKQNYLAVGGHLKNTIAISKGNDIFVSQHIGDLTTLEANSAFEQVISDFQNMYQIHDPLVISDMHPDYLSTKYAESNFDQVEKLQHHIAHVEACRAENQIQDTVIGVSWDGTGFGTDGSVWGGEFFQSDNNTLKHIAQFKKFPLPGGDLAIMEPRRSALGILFEIYGDEIFKKPSFIKNQFQKAEFKLIEQMLLKGINTPKTSSVGRLFDAIASLVDIQQEINYEGQAAMMLEFTANPEEKRRYLFKLLDQDIVTVDWQPMMMQVISDIREKVSAGIISMKFHNTLIDIIVAVCQKVGVKKVLLSGGCFQNVILLQGAVNSLRKNGFHPFWHQRIPPNDGGIALGQVAFALRKQLGRDKVFNKKIQKNIILNP